MSPSKWVRYREPYHARASYISRSLMIGKNIINLAQEDDHSIETMLREVRRANEGRDGSRHCDDQPSDRNIAEATRGEPQ